MHIRIIGGRPALAIASVSLESVGYVKDYTLADYLDGMFYLIALPAQPATDTLHIATSSYCVLRIPLVFQPLATATATAGR